MPVFRDTDHMYEILGKLFTKLLEDETVSKKFYEENCLREQTFFMDDTKKIRDLIVEAISKIGENIRVSRFVRMAIGE